MTIHSPIEPSTYHQICADRKPNLHENVNCDKDARQGIETVKGEVLRIEDHTYVVERSDGKTVELYTDQTIQLALRINRVTSKGIDGADLVWSLPPDHSLLLQNHWMQGTTKT